MNRNPSPSDFSIEVEHVGTLVFGRRTRRDNFHIAAEVLRLSEGADIAGTGFEVECVAQATLATLLVSGPPAFEKLLDLDNEGPDEPLRVVRAYLALLEQEAVIHEGLGQAVGAPAQSKA